MTYQPPAGPPPKYRPRKVWFVVGAGLLVLAVATFVVSLYLVLSPLAREDAVFEAGAGPVEVDLPGGEERALFAGDGESLTCSATDADGAAVDLRGVSGDFTYNEWTAVLQLDTGAGDVTFDCTSSAAGGEVRVGQVPSTGGFVGGLVAGILGPIVLGFAGVATLIITGILTGTRPPRPS